MLRQFVGSRMRQQRDFRLHDVVSDCEEFKGGERPKNDVDLVSGDQLFGFRPSYSRVAGRVGDDKLDLSSSQDVIPLLQENQKTLLHLNATLCERAGLYRQESDANGSACANAGKASAPAPANPLTNVLRLILDDIIGPPGRPLNSPDSTWQPSHRPSFGGCVEEKYRENFHDMPN